MLLVTVESIIPIIFLIGVGFFLNEKKWFNDSFGGQISKIIMNVALPASIFVSVLKYLNVHKLLTVADGLIYTFLSVAIGYVIAFVLTKVFKVRKGRRGVFINTIVNANTIFIGLPLNIAMFGNISLPYFLVYYITNTVSTWAFGAILIQNDSLEGEKAALQKIKFKKLLPPPLLGFLVALAVLFAEVKVPAFVTTSFTYLGSIVTPLSLIYIGIVLSGAGLKSIKLYKDTLVALVGRFLLMPVITIGLVMLCGGTLGTLSPLEAKTFILQSAVPALAVLPILANEGRGDVEYATNVVTTSTIFFVIEVPILMIIMEMMHF